MSRPTSARAIVLQKHADSGADISSLPEYFIVKELPLPNPLPEDSLLVKTVYLSNDPAQRFWMQKPGAHVPESLSDPLSNSFPLGTPFQAFSLSRVVEVGGDSGSFKVGDIVEGLTGWVDYAVVKKANVRVRKEVPGISLSAFLGPLGNSGISSYFTLTELLKPKETDTLVITGAAGALGNVAVQYAKNVLGVGRVVAIAGTDEKCAWLKKLGADEAVNYKSPTFTQDLAKATPDKIDKVLDHVGGTVLDEVMARMKPLGAIVVVGAVSQYNKIDQPPSLKYFVKLILDQLSMTGFTLGNYIARFPEAEEALVKAATSGKLILEGAETVVDVHGRLEDIPRVWVGLFSGANTGKLVTKVTDQRNESIIQYSAYREPTQCN